MKTPREDHPSILDGQRNKLFRQTLQRAPNQEVRDQLLLMHESTRIFLENILRRRWLEEAPESQTVREGTSPFNGHSNSAA